jgi:hypothetical protein
VTGRAVPAGAAPGDRPEPAARGYDRFRPRPPRTPVPLSERPSGIPAFDVVRFTARCPRCGADCLWTEEREDTRVRTRIDCDCPG